MTLFALAGLSVPSFLLATLLILVFALELRLLPPSGYVPFGEDPAQHLKLMVMPALALGLGAASYVTRMTRSSVLETMRQDYVRTAYAKGLRGATVVVRHALKNALIPVITVLGLQLAGLLTGAVVTESVFSRPGLGRVAVTAIGNRDFPLIQGTVLVTAVIYVLVNLLVDLSYAVIDPRIRYG